MVSGIFLMVSAGISQSRQARQGHIMVAICNSGNVQKQLGDAGRALLGNMHEIT
jgi:hypothetical protein